MRNATINRSHLQFMSMAFTQVNVTSFFVLQWMDFYTYYIFIEFQNKSAEQWAIIYFVLSLTNILYYIINVKSFSFSTLTSRLFRETFIKSLLKLVHKSPTQQRSSMRVQILMNTIR